MIDLGDLASCVDLTPEHAKLAASSSAQIRTLLRRVSEIAKPGQGCPKVLMAIARLVGQPWVEGDLRVELSGDDSSTSLVVMCEYGVGIRERLIPVAKFAVPIDEFERALELAPKLVLPLRISEETGKLVLTPLSTPEAHALMATAGPPAVDVDGASLGDSERQTAPPPADELQVVDIALPDELAHANLVVTAPPPGTLATTTPPAHLIATAPPHATAPPQGEPPAREAEPRMESGPVPSSKPSLESDGEPVREEQRISTVHTRPTVRRMVAVDAAAIAALKRRDPRREED